MLTSACHFSTLGFLACAISARVDLYKIERPASEDDFDPEDQIKPTQQLFKFQDTTSAVQFRQDGKLLLTGESNGKVQLFELTNKYVLRNYSEHANRVNCLAWAEDSRRFASCANDTSIRLYDI